MFFLNFSLFNAFLVLVGADNLATGGPGQLSKTKCQEYSRSVRQPNQCSATFFNEGIFASKGEFPHMVMLSTNSSGHMQWYCGGTLISEEFVLVAGHCLTSITPELVRAGVTNLDDSEHSQDIKVEEIIVHPDYKSPSSIYNDIGLVKLERKVDINDNVRPACLHTQRDIDGLLAIATLWGPTEHGRGLEKKLQRQILRFHDQEKCNDFYKDVVNSTLLLKNGITYETMLCAGSNSSGVELRGGGPLQIFHKDYPCMYDIIGIASFGKTTEQLTVFTRLSAYIPWIEEKVWK